MWFELVIFFLACRENEHIPECVPCRALNCGDKTPQCNTDKCKPNKKCYCRPGFLRNEQGFCVKEEECGKYFFIIQFTYELLSS